jgi:hypothetical protein
MNESPKHVEILRGHTSPETALIVDDYPYGFRLRCKIRYWLENKPGRGHRFVSQTSNPKVASEAWNKPKASTYSIGPDLALMFLDEQGHVHWTSIGGYSWPEHVQSFKARFGALLSAEEAEQLAKVETFLRRLSPQSWAEWDANNQPQTSTN